MPVIDLAFRIASYLLQVTLLVLVLRGKQQRRYPFFALLLVVNLLKSISSIIFSYVLPFEEYSVAYWRQETASWPLWFGVVWDLFNCLFPRNSPLRRAASIGLLTILLGLSLAFWGMGGVPRAEMTADVLRKTGLAVAFWLCFHFGLAAYYGLRMERTAIGVSCGLGVIISGAIANAAAYSLSAAYFPWFHYGAPVGFMLGYLIWIWAMWVASPGRGPGEAPPPPQKYLTLWEYYWSKIRKTVGRVAGE